MKTPSRHKNYFNSRFLPRASPKGFSRPIFTSKTGSRSSGPLVWQWKKIKGVRSGYSSVRAIKGVHGRRIRSFFSYTKARESTRVFYFFFFLSEADLNK